MEGLFFTLIIGTSIVFAFNVLNAFILIGVWVFIINENEEETENVKSELTESLYVFVVSGLVLMTLIFCAKALDLNIF